MLAAPMLAWGNVRGDAADSGVGDRDAGCQHDGEGGVEENVYRAAGVFIKRTSAAHQATQVVPSLRRGEFEWHLTPSALGATFIPGT